MISQSAAVSTTTRSTGVWMDTVRPSMSVSSLVCFASEGEWPEAHPESTSNPIKISAKYLLMLKALPPIHATSCFFHFSFGNCIQYSTSPGFWQCWVFCCRPVCDILIGKNACLAGVS
jgi:hypothetical protein